MTCNNLIQDIGIEGGGGGGGGNEGREDLVHQPKNSRTMRIIMKLFLCEKLIIMLAALPRMMILGT